MSKPFGREGRQNNVIALVEMRTGRISRRHFAGMYIINYDEFGYTSDVKSD
ncbi:hypothetical protein E4U54_007452 [Claviceps lovelessii]|nr:hypothetical protein E4U54_007452 [Claviceps lovelessii]